MGHSVLLQDWTTIRTAAAGDLIQGSAAWFEVGSHTDVFFYTETAGVSGANARLFFETAPAPDDAMFRSMGGPRLGPHEAYTTRVRFATASVPLASWVRWKLNTAGASSATFRVWMTLTLTARSRRRSRPRHRAFTGPCPAASSAEREAT